MTPPPTRHPSEDGLTGHGGIGHSTPLVTVSNVHGHGVHRSSGSLTATSTPAGADHPLAAPPVGLAARSPLVTSPVTPPLRVIPATVTPTLVALPPSSPSQHHLQQAAETSMSLDERADAFLLGPSARTADGGLPPLLRPLPLPKDEVGMQRLRSLVVRRAWGDVLQVTGDMLRTAASPHAPLYSSLVSTNIESVPEDALRELQQETVEILTLECHAWLKLRRYADLGREIDQWNFLSHTDSTATSPSWVPWSLHILAAESFQYTDPSSKRCTDILFSLRELLLKKNETVWLTCVDNALSNAFLKQKEWRMALVALDNMFESIKDATEYHVRTQYMPGEQLNEADEQWVVGMLVAAYGCEVLSRQGRIMLQVGALREASILYEKAKAEWSRASIVSNQARVSQALLDKVHKHWIMQHVPAQSFINDGLLSFAHAKYDHAMAHFRKAIDHQRILHNASSPRYLPEDWMGPTVVGIDSHNAVLTQCWNNMSLCALYTCHMKEAVHMMESLIREDPSAFLTERLAFNLCTLYELGSDTAASARKKRILQLIAKRFFLHDIGPESFRVN